MFRFSEILCTFDTLLDSNFLCLENIEYIYNHYKSQKHYGYFETFLQNVVDISSFYRNDRNGRNTKLCYSFMECLEV